MRKDYKALFEKVDATFKLACLESKKELELNFTHFIPTITLGKVSYFYQNFKVLQVDHFQEELKYALGFQPSDFLLRENIHLIKEKIYEQIKRRLFETKNELTDLKHEVFGSIMDNIIGYLNDGPNHLKKLFDVPSYIINHVFILLSTV